MKLSAPSQRRLRRAGAAAFTILELVVAVGAGGLVITSAMIFMSFARVAMSSITAQTLIGDRAGYTIEFIQSRIRVATSVTVDATGNILTLSFDDDYLVDSDNDGKTFNDKTHWESFNFEGTNTTSAAAAAANRMTYTKNVGTSTARVMLPYGVRNLPGYKVFSVPNANTAVIRFGVTDPNGRDRFQSVDIQATAVALNRPQSSNVITFTP